MKLPDYSRCIEIYQLLVAMGVTQIPTLPVVKFEKQIVRRFERKYIDPEDSRISEILSKSAIPVNKSDIVQKRDGLLEYKGRKVVVYIRDQRATVDFYNKRSEYKYHLCNCKTLQQMRDIGREHRYLATQRSDGLFEVHDLTVKPIRKGEVRLELCKNCIEILKKMGIYSYPFNLKEYFDKYDSYTPKTIRRIETVTKIQTYTPDQHDISREYKKACNFKCQLCKVDCREYPKLLHLHHINGDPSDNDRHNLQVLCVDCHSKQPKHSHMLNNPNFKEQINQIIELRIKQGLLTVKNKIVEG